MGKKFLLLSLARAIFVAKNAEFARDWGIAKIFEQNGNEPQRLLELIRQMFIGWEKIVNNVYKKDSPDAKAAQKLVDLVEETVK